MRSLLFLLPLLIACGDPDSDLQSRLEENGVSIDALLEAPSLAEIEAVRQDWAGRDLTPRDVRIELSRTLDDGASLRVVSHRVGPDGPRHFGAILLPPPEVIGEEGLPINISLTGYGPPFTVEFSPEQGAADGVVVIPGYRGQELIVYGERFLSEGDHRDQCDGASDDALALIEVVRADPESHANGEVLAVGGSRGGNVALLLSLRDSMVRGGVSLAGPVDYFVPEFMSHPNMQVLYEGNLVIPALEQGAAGIAESRLRMLRCSPARFAAASPEPRLRWQLHHGTEDAAVPVLNAELLEGAWAAGERDPSDLDVFVYSGEGHSLAGGLAVLNERLEALSSELWPED